MNALDFVIYKYYRFADLFTEYNHGKSRDNAIGIASLILTLNICTIIFYTEIISRQMLPFIFCGVGISLGIYLFVHYSNSLVWRKVIRNHYHEEGASIKGLSIGIYTFVSIVLFISTF
jgi:hypothetical protein